MRRGRWRAAVVAAFVVVWAAAGLGGSARAQERGAAPATEQGAVPADAPRIRFAQPEFNFGSVYQQERVTHEYVFGNVGKSPLSITGTVSTCNCTVIKAPKDPIAPGGKGAVRVTFEAGRTRGKVVKRLFVNSNDPVEPKVVLTLTGEVKVEAMLEPTGLYFGRLAPGETTERTVVIRPVEAKSFRLLSVRSDDRGIALTVPLRKIKPAPDGSYTLTFRIGPYPKAKRVVAQVTIRTTLQHTPELPLPVFGRVAAGPAPSESPEAREKAP